MRRIHPLGVGCLVLGVHTFACGQDDPASASDEVGITSGEGSTSAGESGGSTGAEAPTTGGSTTGTAGGTGGESGGSTADSEMDCEAMTLYPDVDMDGFGDPDQPVEVCVDAGGALVTDNTDCDDGDPDVHPGAAEALCDGVDRDCSGAWKTEVPSICPTIQAAVDVAPAGSTICVLPGMYMEHVVLAGNDLTLLGVQGPGQTIINGNKTGRPLTIASGEGPDTLIQGLMLANGREVEGGGLYVEGASPTIVDVVLWGNSAAENDPNTDYAYGGGAYFRGSSSLLQNVVFKHNVTDYYGGGLSVENSVGLRLVRVRFFANTSAAYGGAAAFYYSSVIGDNLVFAGNHSAGFGGALMAQGGDVTLSQVSAVRNSSESGGGAIIASDGVVLTVRNTVFAENKLTVDPDGGGAIQLCTDYDLLNDMCDPATIVVEYSAKWGNSPVAYFNTPDPTGSAGNIAAPPGFVDLGPPDPAAWDLHLVGGSALIDAGDPAIADKDASPSDIGYHGGPDAP